MRCLPSPWGNKASRILCPHEMSSCSVARILHAMLSCSLECTVHEGTREQLDKQELETHVPSESQQVCTESAGMHCWQQDFTLFTAETRLYSRTPRNVVCPTHKSLTYHANEPFCKKRSQDLCTHTYARTQDSFFLFHALSLSFPPSSSSSSFSLSQTV